MKCPKCGKQIPFTVPPYNRVYRDEKTGELKPSPFMCQCDKEMYDLMVLKLIERWKRATPRGKAFLPQRELSEHKEPAL